MRVLNQLTSLPGERGEEASIRLAETIAAAQDAVRREGDDAADQHHDQDDLDQRKAGLRGGGEGRGGSAMAHGDVRVGVCVGVADCRRVPRRLSRAGVFR